MSGLDWLTPVVPFAVGLGVASVVWWLYDHLRNRSESGRPSAAAPPAPTEPSDPRTAESGERATSPSRPEPGALRTSQRVILHLGRQPRLAFGDVAPASLTQAGMTRALSVSQPALARVLRRLIDGGALLELRTHVSGQPQRLKVYQLTVHGEAIARDLRARSAPLIRPRTSESAARVRDDGESELPT